MTSDRTDYSLAVPLHRNAADQRAAVQREESERAAEREKQIQEQASPFKEPHERILLWEQLHDVRLPRSATHRLIRVIAAQTQLSIQQVREEQQRRVAPAPKS